MSVPDTPPPTRHHQWDEEAERWVFLPSVPELRRELAELGYELPPRVEQWMARPMRNHMTWPEIVDLTVLGTDAIEELLLALVRTIGGYDPEAGPS